MKTDNPTDLQAIPSQPNRRLYQYSLRTLLELTAVVSLSFSLWRWGGESLSRTPEVYVGLAVVLIAAGIFVRRWIWVLAGVVVVVGVLLGTNNYQQLLEEQKKYIWISRQISLVVVDSKMAPVAKANIRISYSFYSTQKSSNTESLSDGSCLIKAALKFIFYGDMGDTEYEIDPQAYNAVDIHIDATGFKPYHQTLSDCLKSQGLSDIPEKEPIIISLTK